MTKVAKKAATKTAAPVAKKTAKVAKAAAPVAKKSKAANAAKRAELVAKRAPNPIMEKLIALMLRKEGATIQDFQQVEGFNIPSMAVVQAAQRAGFKADASKKPGERTVYKAMKV
jgi:hypothetical protein